MLGFIIALMLLWSPSMVWAIGPVVGVDCPITWTASPSPNLREYHILVSHTPGVYPSTTVAAKVPAPATTSTCEALQLTADGQYYLVVTVVDQNGAESIYSNEVPFVRQTGSAAGTPDVTPPAISISQPADRATVARASTVMVQVKASDNLAITRLVLTIVTPNGVGQPLCTLFSAPYQCPWKVPSPANVRYTIHAQAMDQSGNNAQSQIEVTSK